MQHFEIVILVLAKIASNYWLLLAGVGAIAVVRLLIAIKTKY